MSDKNIRTVERQGGFSRLLQEKLRVAKEISTSDVVEAFRGHFYGDIFAVLQQANIPEGEKGLEFLKGIKEHDKEARATLEYYELVQEGDKALPEPEEVKKALQDHLESNPHHLEAIAEMNRPVLQLIPVYDPDGAGFQRMITALNDHRREKLGQDETCVRDELRDRWGMNSATPGRIVGWQVGVLEGEKVRSRESNPYAGQRIEYQLWQSRQDCKRMDLQLCDKRSHALLQMQEIRQAPEGTDLNQLGIDPEYWTFLEDPSREDGSFGPGGSWDEDRVSFDEDSPVYLNGSARFRFSVVVKEIL